MAGLNIGTSVFKRETRSIDEVERKLKNDGWERTGRVKDGRVRYFEKSGINITALAGPKATLIFPSGPIRGALFGDEAVVLNRISSIGEGSSSEEKDNSTRRKRSNQLT